MAKKYPQSKSFEMAPNDGILSDRGIKETASGHASGMHDFGIGHVTNNAMRKDWSDKTYALEQDGDGSMNYMSEKTMIKNKDAAKIRKFKAKVGDAV